MEIPSDAAFDLVVVCIVEASVGKIVVVVGENHSL